MKPLSDYDKIIFDCDGVLLDSNSIKTNAFRETVISYGEDAAQRLVDYHIHRGGISRYEKFRWFFSEVVNLPDAEAATKSAIKKFSYSVNSSLPKCQVADGLEFLKSASGPTPWYIVSGSDEEELKHFMKDANLRPLFDGGIFGSPDTKHNIFSRLIPNAGRDSQNIYFGDSALDHIVAEEFGCDFVFVSKWSELPSWKDYVSSNNIYTIPTLMDYLYD
jgi:phosphoglycolate phosphatase-like HAD superfamily hydrolase